MICSRPAWDKQQEPVSKKKYCLTSASQLFSKLPHSTEIPVPNSFMSFTLPHLGSLKRGEEDPQPVGKDWGNHLLPSASLCWERRLCSISSSASHILRDLGANLLFSSSAEEGRREGEWQYGRREEEKRGEGRVRGREEGRGVTWAIFKSSFQTWDSMVLEFPGHSVPVCCTFYTSPMFCQLISLTLWLHGDHSPMCSRGPTQGKVRVQNCRCL